VLEIIGKRGKDSNPLPLKNAGKATAKTGRAAGGDAKRERFEAKAGAAVELCLPLVNLLLELVIGAGSWSFERLRT